MLGAPHSRRFCFLARRLAIRGFGCALALGLTVGVAPARAEQIVTEAGTSVRYLVNETDPGLGTTWVAPAFDDSAWTTGPYGIGYESVPPGAENLLVTTVPHGTRSVYTRVEFWVDDALTIQNAFVGADYDDGYVVWINGVEVHRSPEMAGLTLDWNAAAGDHESSNAAAPDYFPLQDISAAALPALVTGNNVVAIAVWNSVPTSSDLVLVPKLIVDKDGSLARGPYLQRGSDTEVVVRWRTDALEDSVVHYGIEPDCLVSSVSDPALRTEHEILLTGLQEDTRYCYAVGSSERVLAGDDGAHVFRTAPSAGTARPTRVWVLGDSGTADAGVQNVRDAYYQQTDGAHTDLWLMLGDNAYPWGTDSDYQVALFEMFQDVLRQSVLWPALGNHDVPSGTDWPYFDIFTLPYQGESGGVASGTEFYYSFDYGNIHFVVLDSFSSDRSPGSAQWAWLEADLADTALEWIIAFWHHPPYSKGSHDSDSTSGEDVRLKDMRENALPILEDYGVDLVLSGHSHSYERSFLIDGFYATPTTVPGDGVVLDAGDGRESGTGLYVKPPRGITPYGAAPGDGAVYVVTGSVGQTSGGPLNHPVMQISLNLRGSVVLEVDGSRLDAMFLDDTQAQRDSFTLIKCDDADADRICDADDNCPQDANATQIDADGDGAGDACDTDDDADGVPDTADSDPLDPNACRDVDQDSCDDCVSGTDDPAADGSDLDADGSCDAGDNCPVLANADQADLDEDGAGDVCDLDDDGDGVEDVLDASPGDPFVCRDLDLDTCDDCAGGSSDPFADGPDFDADGQCDAGDVDDDNDGVNDAQDGAPLNPMSCRDVDLDGCDDCAGGSDDPANDGADADGDGLCDAGDNCPGASNADQTDTDGDLAGDACDADDDNDGVGDAQDSQPLDPFVCRDADADGCDDCKHGSDDPSNDGSDTDGDGLCDLGDADDDNDGVPDAQDSAPFDAMTCRDADGDSCDDCVSGTDAPAADGPDFDADGVCDAGDADDDGDGVEDGLDQSPFDAFACRDADADSCDDCSTGTDAPADDGADFDGDGLCDAGDADDDGDGVADAQDSAPFDRFVCRDTDGDLCDDCSSGNDKPLNDGPDGDGDGSCDAGDVDDDNDGVDDGQDAAPLDPFVCRDVDNDTCDDCSSGSDAPYNDGPDVDGDGVCDAGDACVDADGDGLGNGTAANQGCVAAWTDTNDSNSVVCADADGDGCDDCATGTFDPAADGPDGDGDGLCDTGDPCPADSDNDPDADGVCQDADNCTEVSNPAQADADADGVGDACDPCAGDTMNDPDADGLCAASDNCPTVFNPSQRDDDQNGVGSACEYVVVGGSVYLSATEVTHAQYAAFLNAVAASDPGGLFSISMQVDDRGGITRSGSQGDYSYSTRPQMARKPVNFVSWLDAARYVNWLHNGTPNGPQTPWTTEDGAYDLTVSDPGNNASRRAGATWFLPTRARWDQAAYEDPASGQLFDYPLRSDATPIKAEADSSGDVSNPGFNVANYGNGADWAGQNGHMTSVAGAGPSAVSPWGTHDQAGNVAEWVETSLANSRFVRGGDWDENASDIHRLDDRTLEPGSQFRTVGFRVAAVTGCTDTDGDGYGVPGLPGCPAGLASDIDDTDPFACRDDDGDTCDDCSSGTADTGADGPDTDGDGLCNAGDEDDDGDGVPDGEDQAPQDPFACRDQDQDGCDDCTTGSSNPTDDGPDWDADGLCDAGDTDDDADGVVDVADAEPLNPWVCRDADTDGCEDCTSGTDDPANDGPDADVDGVCDVSDNCAQQANPSQHDLDGDGQGDVCDADDDGDGVDDPDDCAPNSRALTGPPGPIGSTLRLGLGSPTRLSWNRGYQGHTSNVYRRSSAAGTPSFECLASGVTPTFFDDSAQPPPATLWLYLVTASNGCGESTPDVPAGSHQPRQLEACPVTGDDSDADGHVDRMDNCSRDANSDQHDGDGDFVGDVCDNCGAMWNPGQGDCDGNSVGDVCDAASDCDDDGWTNPSDNCPDDPNPGQQDADGDGSGDVCDGCPDNPELSQPGVCGCGEGDTDTDGDQTPDCADEDDDNDGVADVEDSQPFDPFRCADQDADGCDDCAVGLDGFGPQADADPGNDGPDGDGDGTCDLTDGCAADPDKTEPGACGCGAPETDSDEDGAPDCVDECPADSSKSVPGQCGCGNAECWVLQASGTNENFEDVDFPSDASTGFAVAREGVGRKTTDGGQSWSAFPTGTDIKLNGIVFPGGGAIGYIVGDEGTVLKSVDAGANWISLDSDTSAALKAVAFPDGDLVGIAVGGGGLILKTDDGGLSWDPRPSGTGENLESVFFTDATDGWAVGRAGALVATTDGGQSWTSQPSGTGADLKGLFFSESGATGYIVGNLGTLLRSTDAGQTWNALPVPTIANLRDVHFTGAVGYLVGNGGIVLKSSDAGNTWIEQSSAAFDNLHALEFSPDQSTAYAVGKLGIIVKRIID